MDLTLVTEKIPVFMHNIEYDAQSCDCDCKLYALSKLYAKQIYSLEQ